MKATIQPYEYFYIKTQITNLINVYQSVNDPATVKTFEAMTREKVYQIFDTTYPEIDDLLTAVMDPKMTKKRAEGLLETFKDFVIPFKAPSTKQVEKAFRKVKKLHHPDFETLDLRENTFLAWLDAGSQKKFILLELDGRLTGLYGDFPPNVKKGICTICQHEANVALFLATTKSSGDGTYTKKGNYICTNSDLCNQQTLNRTGLEAFARTVLAK